jgi:alpha-tubulin suppressor-like RCC1 family protein
VRSTIGNRQAQFLALAQRAVAVLACAAAFAACEGVSRHPSADDPSPNAGGNSGASGDGSLGSSGSVGTGGSGDSAGNGGSGGSVGQGSTGSNGSTGDSGDASQGSGGTGGSATGGTAGVGGSAGSASGGTGGLDGSPDSASGGTAGLDGSAGDSGAPDGSDGGSCLPGCPSSAPVCSAGACRKIKQIAPGGLHSCALVDDGTVRCWGYNNELQLGDSSRGPRLTPGPAISGLTDVEKLNAGYEHTCAVTRAGSVWCWGNNYYGQLGFTGETVGPVEVRNLGGPAEEVKCHGAAQNLTGYTCARMSSGRVRCWGSNLHGELGNGTRDASSAPGDVLNLTDAVGIGLGEYSACAVKSTGKVVCWGYNEAGQLATGSTADVVTTPEEVLGLSDVQMVDGGEHHFCAITGPDRRVKCWGQDLDGALGDGPPINGVAGTVVDVAVSGVGEVRTGFHSTCIRLQDGDVGCWGHNAYGEFGNGNQANTTALSSLTLLAAPAVSMEFRWGIGCAILNTGRAQCWGSEGSAVGSGNSGVIVDTPEFVVW